MEDQLVPIIEYPLKEYETNNKNNQVLDLDTNLMYYVPKTVDEEKDSTNDKNNQVLDLDTKRMYYIPKMKDEEKDSMLNIRDEFDNLNPK